MERDDRKKDAVKRSSSESKDDDETAEEAESSKRSALAMEPSTSFDSSTQFRNFTRGMAMSTRASTLAAASSDNAASVSSAANISGVARPSSITSGIDESNVSRFASQQIHEQRPQTRRSSSSQDQTQSQESSRVKPTTSERRQQQRQRPNEVLSTTATSSGDMMDARFYRQPNVPYQHFHYPPPYMHHPLHPHHTHPYYPSDPYQPPGASNTPSGAYHPAAPVGVVSHDMSSSSYASAASSTQGGTGDIPEKKESIASKRPRGRPKGSTNKGKPKRPLSAYNIFFKEERARILEAIPDAGKRGSSRRKRAKAVSSDDYDSKPRAKDAGVDKKKPHGKIGFENLAKLIASRWQSLTPDELEPYNSRAKVEADRYKKELELCKTKEEANLKKKAKDVQESSSVASETQHHISVPPSDAQSSISNRPDYHDKQPVSSSATEQTPSSVFSSVFSSDSYQNRFKSPPRSVAQAKARIAAIEKNIGQDDPAPSGWIEPTISPIRLHPPGSGATHSANTTTIVTIGRTTEDRTVSAPTKLSSRPVTVLGENVKGKKSFVLGQAGFTPTAHPPSSPHRHPSPLSNLFENAETFFDSTPDSNDAKEGEETKNEGDEKVPSEGDDKLSNESFDLGDLGV